MKVIDRIVKRLKSVPEGDGTMFDNTMLFISRTAGRPITVTAGSILHNSLGR